MSKFNYMIAGAFALTAGIATAQTPQAQAVQQSQMPGTSSSAAASTQPAAPAASQPATGAAQSSAMQTATAADIKAGAPVLDAQGGSVGTIESVTADGAVLSTGKVRVQLAMSSFGKNDKGLVIGMNKAQIEAEAAKAGGTGG